MDTHPRVALGEGDTVIFSSRVIPGNERAIGTVQDNLVRRGVQLMTDADHMVHVSGHPARDELAAAVSAGEAALLRCRCMASGGICRRMRRWRGRPGATPILMEDGDILSLAPGARGDRRQRAGGPAGAGRRPPGAAGGRGDGGAAAHAVQRRRAGEPRGG